MNVYTRVVLGILGERRFVMSDFPLTPSQRRRLEQQLRATKDAGVFRRTLAVHPHLGSARENLRMAIGEMARWN